VGSALEIVIFVVVAIGLLAAVISAIMGQNSLYDEIGRGGLSVGDRPSAPEPPPGSPAARAELQAEVRQMLQARSDRRVRRGQPPLDIDAELDRRLADAGAPALDAEVIDEIRQLAIARNARRERRGQPPLDIDAEVARAIRELDV
jgi:cytochrome P450